MKIPGGGGTGGPGEGGPRGWELRWAKTRVLQNGHARVETRVLKTLACEKLSEAFFEHWQTACWCVLKNARV